MTAQAYQKFLAIGLLEGHDQDWIEVKGEMWALEKSSYSFLGIRIQVDEWIKITSWNKQKLLNWLGY